MAVCLDVDAADERLPRLTYLSPMLILDPATLNLPEATRPPVAVPDAAEDLEGVLPLTADMDGAAPAVLPPERREVPPARAIVLPPVTPLPERTPTFRLP